MDIHKPKPIHNLREFLSEITVIVIGVAIALTGEQVVDWISWNHRAAEARDSIGLELGIDTGGGEGRMKLSRCIAARIDSLASAVDAGAATGRLPPIGPIRRPPDMPWQSELWRNAQTSQAAAHLRRGDQNAIAMAHINVSTLHDLDAAERAPWARLSALSGPGRALPTEEAVALRAALAEAIDLNASTVGSVLRLRESIDGTGIRLDPVNERAVAGSRFWIPQDCAPAGPVAAGYATRKLDEVLTAIRADPLDVAGDSRR